MTEKNSKWQKGLHETYIPEPFRCRMDLSSFGLTVTVEPPTKLQSLCN